MKTTNPTTTNLIPDNKTPESYNQRNETRANWLVVNKDSNFEHKSASAQAQHSPQYKLGPAEREEVNSLMASVQEDLESVLYQLVWQRDDAKAHAQRLADALTWIIGDDTSDEPAIVEGREALAEWSKSI